MNACLPRLRFVCASVFLSSLQRMPPPTPIHTHTHLHVRTSTKATSEVEPHTGRADQSITSLLQQSNKVIIRQQLTDLERPGQSKAAVMRGPALAHVTVTQNGSSCCHGIEWCKVERQLRLNSKEKTGESVGRHPENIRKSTIPDTHLDGILRRTGGDKKRGNRSL